MRTCKGCGLPGVRGKKQYCERDACKAERKARRMENDRLRHRVGYVKPEKVEMKGSLLRENPVNTDRQEPVERQAAYERVRKLPFVECEVPINEDLFRTCLCGRVYLTNGTHDRCPFCRGVYPQVREVYNHKAVTVA